MPPTPRWAVAPRSSVRGAAGAPPGQKLKQDALGCDWLPLVGESAGSTSLGSRREAPRLRSNRNSTETNDSFPTQARGPQYKQKGRQPMGSPIDGIRWFRMPERCPTGHAFRMRPTESPRDRLLASGFMAPAAETLGLAPGSLGPAPRSQGLAPSSPGRPRGTSERIYAICLLNFSLYVCAVSIRPGAYVEMKGAANLGHPGHRVR